MKTNWTTPAFQLALHRYPKGQHDKSLQAWDSADELLTEHVIEHFSESASICVFNDSFGALALALDQFRVTSVSDSKIAQLATLENATENGLSGPEFLNSLSPLPLSDLVIVKLTKNLAFLESQLHQIATELPHSTVIAGGKTTQVTKGALAIFDKYFEQVSTSLAKKKSRLIHASQSKSPLPSLASLKGFDWPEKNLKVDAYSNVFSREQLDIGGRFLAENLPQDLSQKVIVDLGCGNGLLGLTALTEQMPSEVQFVDESYMAVQSAAYNVSQNCPEHSDRCQYIQNDCLTGFKSANVDVILCNPPFHQQNAITEHIALQMFKDAKRVLKDSGTLYVVANRHLPYQKPLKKHFGGFKVFAQNKKFIIYQSTKRTPK